MITHRNTNHWIIITIIIISFFTFIGYIAKINLDYKIYLSDKYMKCMSNSGTLFYNNQSLWEKGEDQKGK